jgi:beta-glucosidase
MLLVSFKLLRIFLFEPSQKSKLMSLTIGNILTFQEHRLLGREAVRKSLVLLKNGKDQKEPFLPLAKDAKRILVAGTHADDIGYQCGGWTIAWHGDSGKITLGKKKLYFAKKKKNCIY